MSTIKAIRLLEDMLHPEQWGHAIPVCLAKSARPVLEALKYDHRRIYLCGPMSGIHGYNIPAFADAATALRARGHSVFAPHENGLDIDSQWRAHMRVDIAALMSCGRMALLTGWAASKGATLEHHIACALEMEVRPLAHYLGTPAS
jgi:hypothetical protein